VTSTFRRLLLEVEDFHTELAVGPRRFEGLARFAISEAIPPSASRMAFVFTFLGLARRTSIEGHVFWTLGTHAFSVPPFFHVNLSQGSDLSDVAACRRLVSAAAGTFSDAEFL